MRYIGFVILGILAAVSLLGLLWYISQRSEEVQIDVDTEFATLEIRDADLQFYRTPARRQSTARIVLHHSHSAPASVQEIHDLHQGPPRNWIGIGYHFVVMQNGEVWRGRPIEWVGAHTEGYNLDSIGICFVGRYHTWDRTMPDAQFNAGVRLLQYIRMAYGDIPISGHRDHTVTACPGQHFPLEELIALRFRGEYGGLHSY